MVAIPFYKRIIPAAVLSPFYIILGCFLYWAVLAEFPPAKIEVIDYFPRTLAAGDELTIRYTGEAYRDCVYHITRSLHSNQFNTVIGYSELSFRKKQSGIFDSKFIIPISVPDGPYSLKIDVEPVCNFYDSVITKRLPISDFKITINSSPGALYDDKILNPVIKEGETLLIENHYLKTRFCKTTVDTFITLSDNTIVNKFSRSSAVTELGEGTLREELDPKVPPGKYMLKRSITYECPEKTYRNAYPNQTFEVTK